MFVRLAFFPDGTVEHYRAVDEALAGAPVPGERLVFIAGPVSDGWQVVQVWTHRRALDEWNAAWFLPTLGRLGPAGFPRAPLVTDFTADDHDLRLDPRPGSGR